MFRIDWSGPLTACWIPTCQPRRHGCYWWSYQLTGGRERWA